MPQPAPVDQADCVKAASHIFGFRKSAGLTWYIYSKPFHAFGIIRTRTTSTASRMNMAGIIILLAISIPF